MKIAKIRNVRTPERGTSLSAGIDFFIPEFNESFVRDLVSKNTIRKTPERYLEDRMIQLYPQERFLIPSGIKVNFEGEPKALIAYNKSGISTKRGLDVLACVIDQDYQGEIHLSLVNTSDERICIMEFEKVVQFILVPIFYDTIELVNEDVLWDKKTDRGEGGFGHTNK